MFMRATRGVKQFRVAKLYEMASHDANACAYPGSSTSLVARNPERGGGDGGDGWWWWGKRVGGLSEWFVRLLVG